MNVDFLIWPFGQIRISFFCIDCFALIVTQIYPPKANSLLMCFPEKFNSNQDEKARRKTSALESRHSMQV